MVEVFLENLISAFCASIVAKIWQSVEVVIEIVEPESLD